MPSPAWADRNMESAGQLVKIVEHVNQSQPNTWGRPPAPTCRTFRDSQFSQTYAINLKSVLYLFSDFAGDERNPRVRGARGGKLRPGVCRVRHVVPRGHRLRPTLRSLSLPGRHSPRNIQGWTAQRPSALLARRFGFHNRMMAHLVADNLLLTSNWVLLLTTYKKFILWQNFRSARRSDRPPCTCRHWV